MLFFRCCFVFYIFIFFCFFSFFLCFSVFSFLSSFLIASFVFLSFCVSLYFSPLFFGFHFSLSFFYVYFHLISMRCVVLSVLTPPPQLSIISLLGPLQKNPFPIIQIKTIINTTITSIIIMFIIICLILHFSFSQKPSFSKTFVTPSPWGH